MAASDQLQSIVRFPHFKVTANGKPINFSQVEVIQNGHHEADSYDVQAPLFDPKASYDWAWWASTTDIEIEISVGFADDKGTVNNWTSLIIGPVDGVSESPVAFGPHSTVATRGRTEIGRGGMLPNEDSPPHPYGAMLQVRGRDYSGQLIDSDVSNQQISGNLTSQNVFDQIMSQIPGVKLDLSQVPSDSVGSLANNIQGRLNLHRSAWDIITAAADHENMRATMKGRTLTIAPSPVDGQSGSQPYKLFYTPVKGQAGGADFMPARSNCVTLRLARALSVGRGVSQFVQSYDSQTGRRPSRAVASTRSSSRSSQASAGQMGNPLTYTDNVPGMSAAQTRKHAAAKANKVSKFEREIEFQIPGDPALTVDTAVSLSGTGTAFDLTYEMTQLTHFFDLTQGYRMEGRGRNKSSDVAVTVKDVTTGNQPAAAVQLPSVPDYSLDQEDEG